jgi:uncharacterized membrane protein
MATEELVMQRDDGRTDTSIRAPNRAVEDSRALRLTATGLGWFSVALGLAEAIAPRAIAGLVGARNDDTNRTLIRAFGARELTAGLGILSGRRSAGWVWARVAGDVLDLVALGIAARSARRGRSRNTAITVAVAGITAVDVLTAAQLTRRPRGALLGGVDVSKSITVNRPPADVYARFRNLERLPRFMSHLESVTVHSDKHSTWRAKAPLGTTVEWEAEITTDVPSTLIAWRSLPGATIQNEGSVSFRPAPGDRGTEIHVHLKYQAPGGAVGRAIALLFGEEPGVQVAADLRRFKQMMEVGDVVDSDASVHQGPHPGRPSNGGRKAQVHP